MRVIREMGWREYAALGVHLLAVVVLSLLDGGRALAAPLDLLDATPRWVQVRFEVSPADAPGQLNATWSRTRSAYLDREPGQSTIRIRIPADEIEAHLRTTGAETVSGSFSEFIWRLDPETGHVLDAAFSGRVREQFSLGLIRASALVEIRVEMSTRASGGFRTPRGLFGRMTHAFCSPSTSAADCIPVRPARFDPESGYVNAVGALHVATRLATIRAFSPLGEVRFSEQSGPTVETVVSGASLADRVVCSPSSGGSCQANLGGGS